MIANGLRIDQVEREPTSGGGLRALLLLLLRAFEGAEEVDGAPDGLAPVGEEVVLGGVSVSLPALQRAGYVEVRPDRVGRDQRRASKADRETEPQLVLTTSGAEFLRTILAGADGEARRAATIPYWDGRLLQLWWRGACIREYRHDAANQRLVLDGFEAEQWPKRLDDPLPREQGVNVKIRLCETIKGLNRGQRPHLLRFRGDGTGLGVRWEPVA
jgi:hypothetical protein